MAIYTRTGDKGKTSLFDGTRVLKSSRRVEAYGTIDELNSFIGVARVECQQIGRSESQNNSKNDLLERVVFELEEIAHDLLSIGSTLATPAGMPVIGLAQRPEEFEKLIDDLTTSLPPLRNFILPGGGRAGAFLHVCRTVTRRAERQVIALMQEEEIDLDIVKYLNRLSDLFFTLARYVNFVSGEKETIWRQK
jgi:cob(I)alamin adenosyltransferase